MDNVTTDMAVDFESSTLAQNDSEITTNLTFSNDGNETMKVDEDEAKKPLADVDPWGPLSMSLQSQIYLLGSVLVFTIIIFGISIAVLNRRVRR